jgi:hypothetical protein
VAILRPLSAFRGKLCISALSLLPNRGGPTLGFGGIGKACIFLNQIDVGLVRSVVDVA